MSPGISAVLLAGGRSTRMGEDKAFVTVGGVPAWKRQMATLQALHPSEILVSAHAGQLFQGLVDARLIYDEVEEQGPLGGLVTALRSASEDYVLVLGVDLLQMPQEFLQRLCANAENGSGMVYRSGAYFEPLAALYPRSLLPQAERSLSEGQLSLQSLLSAAVESGLIQECALTISEKTYFSNVNTQEDLAAFRIVLGDADTQNLSDTGNPAATVQILRWGKDVVDVADQLATEAPLEIRVEGKSVAVVMRTPGNDKELVLGFLISEGILNRPEDVFQISHCPSQEGGNRGNVMDVLLRNPDAAQLDGLTRHVFSSSSCGICGKATLDSVFVQFPKVKPTAAVSAATLFQAPAALRAAQETFEITGGIHASAVFDRTGELLILREDVGRHNALDKVLGSAFLNGWLPLNNHILLVSGRISFELMQKSLAAGIPIVAGISAPSSLAVDFARGSGQTLCGFLRGEKMNIYAHPERIVVEE
ncbi:MAG: FdhD protein [Verrucomicrobiales bacterium]|jgi:FdhD protein